MKKEIEDLINSDIRNLKKNVEDKVTYEHIIASILEIYTENLSYPQVLQQIENDVENLNESENNEVWASIYFLAKLMDANDSILRYIYKEEILEDEEGWKKEIKERIYDFIYENS